MLIEFRVKNFRSFRDETVFSMVASKDRTQRETHTAETGFKAIPNVLRTSVLYGANASGKSNLIRAVQYMREVVIGSAKKPNNEEFDVDPFRFNSVSETEPTEFEISFFANSIRYQYGFSLTAQRIVSEHLFVYTSSKPQRWIDRCFDEDEDKDFYESCPGLRGDKTRWQRATQPKTLFLSIAVHMGSDALRPVFDWFLNHLIVVNDQAPLGTKMSTQMLDDDVSHARIVRFLHDMDLGIAEVFVPAPDSVQADIEFIHKANGAEIRIPLQRESSGTKKLFEFVGPLIKILDTGATVFFDELDISLHPLIVQQIVRFFTQSEINPRNAQLIFSSHSASHLDAFGLFRRDQIWFIEKHYDQASRLTPLSDFRPRKGEALQRGYLTGRYQGVPLLEETFG